MSEIPEQIRRAREQWTFRGDRRPDFAEPVSAGQESVWDYPRPPAAILDEREVIVRSGDSLIARSSRCIRILETASPPTFYVPRDDVKMEYLQSMPQRSVCEWKGMAAYWSVELPCGSSLPNVAWSYEKPFPEYQQIAGFLSFYPAHLECYVAGTRVAPQPGNLYGGWVTPEVIGPFKGAPGTSNW